MSGIVATQMAIRALMRVLPRELAERALAEMEAECLGQHEIGDCYDLGKIIQTIRADLHHGRGDHAHSAHPPRRAAH